MSLEILKKLISRRDPVNSIARRLELPGSLVALDELASDAKGVIASCIVDGYQGQTVIIAYSQEEAERIAEALVAHGAPSETVRLVPSGEGLLFEDGIPDARLVGARVAGMAGIALGRPGVYVMPFTAALSCVMRRADFASAITELREGETLDLQKGGLMLVERGYVRADLVSDPGEFSIRGCLLDVWPPTEDQPVRIELFDDEIESIRSFDVESQRSKKKMPAVALPPAREVFIGQRGENAANELSALLAEQADALRRAGRYPDAEALELKVNSHLNALRQGVAFNSLEYYLPYLNREPVCLLDWFADDALFIWDEPSLSKTGFQRLGEEVAEILKNRAHSGQALGLDRGHHVSFDKAVVDILSRRCVVMSSLTISGSVFQGASRVRINSGGMESFGAQAGVFAENVRRWIDDGFAVVVVTSQVLRIGQMLLELGVRPIHGQLRGDLEPGVWMVEGMLPAGYRLPDMKLIVVAESDIFGVGAVRRPRITRRDTRPIQSILDLKEGDYIVHIRHGIGIYRGLRNLTNEKGSRDYLMLEYAGGDKLYVPADQTDRIQRYSGADSGPPSIHKLGGSDWARTKKRVKESVREMAKELLQVYAAREALGGYAFPPDTPWQAEMEQAFPYTETPDQLMAINDVKADLESNRPMDRLVCGDVGFGKTEVAIRAAFKVVVEGRQVAVLAPTTVLAQQHFNVFSERLAAFPIKVEMLSRFRSAREQKIIIDDLKAGNVDIVVGTHRLLSKDVAFKNLGLVVVDEEQRFGVSHKERLKQLRVSVDVLTLTATPIPRTLQMSLAGIRDMSVINQAPEGRTPVRTYVREYDDEMVREAIVRELDRDGQVFFVHNRVESIHEACEKLQKLVPHARIAIAHGQMGEHELEKVMFDFYHRKFDVLVCTTIIESGLDIPLVNTIIINNADKLGLAQLYQLRGRVGRSDRQAYAYLLYRSDEILTEIAEKRLSAIREFADLGSGFKVAMRDLEIRGAGNILGPEQHGQMISVGFDMYCHLLSQAVKELKGEKDLEKSLPPVELALEAYIPQSYIDSEGMRISIYRKMSACMNEDDVSKLEEELTDRFGNPHKPLKNALDIIRLKILADAQGIASVTEEQGRIVVTFQPGVSIDPEHVRQLQRAIPEHRWDTKRVSLYRGANQPVELVTEFIKLVSRSLVRPDLKSVSAK